MTPLDSQTTASHPASAAPAPFSLRRCPLPLLDELYTNRTVELLDGSKKSLDVWIPREEGDFLYSLVRHFRPEVTVEIGMANGFSSLYIAQALSENGRGRHIAMDPFQMSDWGGAALASLRRAGLDSLVRLIEKPSHQALAQLEEEGERTQFVFIDGSHMFDYVVTDFLLADRILTEGGLLAFDDSDWRAISKVLRFVLANRHFEVAFPEVIIEDPCYRPSLAGQLVRSLSRVLPPLRRKLRPDLLVPDYELGLRGRCVVLKKLKEDDRNTLGRYFIDF
jgi:predicted O-methyltransferase YrrM